MTEPLDVAGAVVHFLRQRQELGLATLTLDSMSRADLEQILRTAGARRTLPQAVHAAEPRSATVASSPRAPRAAQQYRAQHLMAQSPTPQHLMAQSPTPQAPMEAPRRGGDLGELPDALPVLQALCAGCTRCGLSETRTRTVFADGNPGARLMVVGEAPGQNEDEQGLPFVGRAGLLLDLLLQTIGHSRRDSVYICNVIKCRPPGNRNPTREEIATCTPYLKQQIALVRPSILLALGTFAGQFLSGKDDPLGQLRRDVHAYEGVPLVVTYHPAALLRNSGWIPATWQDLQRVGRMLRELPGAAP